MRVPDGCPLTPLQLEILRLAADGHAYKAIAERRGVSVNTIRSNFALAYRRLGVAGDGNRPTREKAIRLCIQNGWIVNQDVSSGEAVILTRIEQLLEELVTAIEHRNERMPLSQTQRAYLESFLAWLKAPSHLVEQRRESTVERLGFVLREANVRYP